MENTTGSGGAAAYDFGPSVQWLPCCMHQFKSVFFLKKEINVSKIYTIMIQNRVITDHNRVR